MGFVTKVESQEMLMSKPNGSFLLRFSDSELGGITIAWVADQEGLYLLLTLFRPMEFSIYAHTVK